MATYFTQLVKASLLLAALVSVSALSSDAIAQAEESCVAEGDFSAGTEEIVCRSPSGRVLATASGFVVDLSFTTTPANVPVVSVDLRSGTVALVEVVPRSGGPSFCEPVIDGLVDDTPVTRLVSNCLLPTPSNFKLRLGAR